MSTPSEDFELALACLKEAEDAAVKVGGVALYLASGEGLDEDREAMTKYFGTMMSGIREAHRLLDLFNKAAGVVPANDEEAS